MESLLWLSPRFFLKTSRPRPRVRLPVHRQSHYSQKRPPALLTRLQKRTIKIALAGTLVVATAATTAFYWPEISFVAHVLSRSFRTARVVSAIALDYKKHYVPDSPEQNTQLHQRSADRLLKLLRKRRDLHQGRPAHCCARVHPPRRVHPHHGRPLQPGTSQLPRRR